MAEDANWLLTDEFVVFSDKIKQIHQLKKQKKQEIKDFFKQTELEIKNLDLEAKKLQDEFYASMKQTDESGHKKA